MLSLVVNLCLIFLIFSKGGILPIATSDTQTWEMEREYPHLSKRILQEYQNDILISFNTLRDELNAVSAPWGNTFGFYFEYLPTGVSIGINSTADFYTASLVKVPIIMAFLKNVEDGEFDIDKKVVIESRHADPAFGSLWKNVGKEISLRDAVRLSLTESDNTASMILRDFISEEDLISVYEGLDMELVVEQKQGVLNARQYTSILKALYFASIVNKENSEMILDYLADSKFKDKLAAGVPEGTDVANKIGVLPGQLYSDCGIVYVPRRPYVLCMISGTDEETARQRMKQVSTIVYKFVTGINN